MHADTAISLPAFSVALDDLWTAVDPGGLQDGAAISATLDERVSDGHLTPEERDGILALAARWGGTPLARDLAFMAVLTAYDEDSGLVIASLSLAFHVHVDPAGAAEPSASDDPVDGITLRSREPAAAPALPTVRRVGGAGRAESDVTVDGRPGRRVAEVARLAVADGVAQEVFTVQYILPADDPAVTLIATATSPAVASREALEPVFDRALASIELYASQPEPAGATA